MLKVADTYRQGARRLTCILSFTSVLFTTGSPKLLNQDNAFQLELF